MPFQKGKSGNPGGRPKETAGLRLALQKRYGKFGKPLFDRLHRLSASDNERVALSAIEIILAYQFGKPTQPSDVNVSGHMAIFALPAGDRPAATTDEE